MRVLRRKLWGKKGSRKKITGQRRKDRVNVMGAVRYSDKKRVKEDILKRVNEKRCGKRGSMLACIIR